MAGLMAMALAPPSAAGQSMISARMPYFIGKPVELLKHDLGEEVLRLPTETGAELIWAGYGTRGFNGCLMGPEGKTRCEHSEESRFCQFHVFVDAVGLVEHWTIDGDNGACEQVIRLKKH